MSDLSHAEALALVKSYHQRTKHRFEGYAAGPGSLDWDAQPAAFRHFDGAPQLALPRLGEIPPDSALYKVLQQPFGSPTTTPLPVDLASIGAWLQLSLGITAWKSLGPDRWAVRANPSSGNLHPVEAYLLVSGIAGLTDGVHHYRPEQHGLELRATHPVGADKAPQLAVVLSSVMWREAWKYGERAFRYCQLDVGHATAALHYAATALGWAVSEQPQIGNATLARLCGIDRSAEFPASLYPETEREEAELMLKVGAGDTATGALNAAELQALSAAAQWYGSASGIDRHPMYRWPLIEEVAAATRQGDSAVSPAPTFLPVATQATYTNATAVQTLLTKRRSAQRFDGRYVMPLAAFAAIISTLKPHAAGTHIAMVFFIHRVERLEPGLYLLPRHADLIDALRKQLDPCFEFSPVNGIDELLRLTPLDPTELQRLTRRLHCHQDIAATACFAVGMLSAFSQALSSGPAAYRSLYRECGALGQVLYLEAEAHGVRGTGIGCFFDDPVHNMLGLKNDADWQTLYHFTVGLPIDDARIETTPAYSKAAAANLDRPDMNTTTEISSTVQCLCATDAARLIKSGQTLTLFDVRDIASYQRGHVEQAMHLSQDRVPNWINRLPKHDPVVIYCYRGHASKAYAQMFVDFRFSRVFSVDGGYESLAGALLVPPASQGTDHTP